MRDQLSGEFHPLIWHGMGEKSSPDTQVGVDGGARELCRLSWLLHENRLHFRWFQSIWCCTVIKARLWTLLRA